MNRYVKAMQFYNKKQASANNIKSAIDVRDDPAVRAILRRAYKNSATKYQR
jgi:hypothetical protein